MTKRTIYRVTYNNEKEQWNVKKDGAKRPSASTETKEEAVQTGIGLARKQDHSQLVIRKVNGEIQEERTYGNDPYPPKG